MIQSPIDAARSIAGTAPSNPHTKALLKPSDARVRSFLEAQLEALRRLPGIAGVGVNTALPFGGNTQDAVILVEGHTLAPGELPPVPFRNFIDAGYFQTMGIPLLQGRTIAESDRDGAPLVAVIDQHMARKYWPKGDAVGARVRMGLGRNPLDDYWDSR